MTRTRINNLENQLKVAPRELDRGIYTPIDTVFRSLAADKREQAIGIILSGTGSDGTKGMKSIEVAGGMTIVQDPDDAGSAGNGARGTSYQAAKRRTQGNAGWATGDGRRTAYPAWRHLQLLAEGRTSPQIGEALNISNSTVEAHRRNIMKKLDLHSVAELTKYAVREGLTSL